jgi:hypothetical protein
MTSVTIIIYMTCIDIKIRTHEPQYNWWQYNIYFKNRDAFIYRLSEYCGNKMKYNAHCKQCRIMHMTSVTIIIYMTCIDIKIRTHVFFTTMLVFYSHVENSCMAASVH